MAEIPTREKFVVCFKFRRQKDREAICILEDTFIFSDRIGARRKRRPMSEMCEAWREKDGWQEHAL